MIVRLATYSVAAVFCAAGLASLVTPPGFARAEADRTVMLTEADCRRTVRSHPPAGAAYRPGVDVNGRPVRPADLEGSGVARQETVTLELTADMFEAYGINPPTAGADGTVSLGVLEFKGNRVRFNGKALNAGEIDGLIRLCREHYPSPR